MCVYCIRVSRRVHSTNDATCCSHHEVRYSFIGNMTGGIYIIYTWPMMVNFFFFFVSFNRNTIRIELLFG